MGNKNIKTKTPNRKKFIYFILAGLLVIVLILVFGREKESNDEIETINHQIVGEYYDDICKVKFGYPKSWTKSNLILPLPQEPLSEATFDEPGKNSIFSFVCYDARNYSFAQFMQYNLLSSGGVEEINVEGIRWQRVGNFIYTTQKNKLIIFEMFFTKYDLKPESGYEETFLNIVKTVRF